MNDESNAFPVIPSIVLSTAHYEQMKQQIESLTREKDMWQRSCEADDLLITELQAERDTMRAELDAANRFLWSERKDGAGMRCKEGIYSVVMNLDENSGETWRAYYWPRGRNPLLPETKLGIHRYKEKAMSACMQHRIHTARSRGETGEKIG